jgi:hypothetical protein
MRSILRTFFAMLLLASLGHGQSAAAAGTISGVVADVTGAAIPGAIVTIKNTDFTFTRALVTDGLGSFTATFLPPGAYTVEVKATGFQMKRPARVALGVGSSVQVNVRLEIPQTRQEVTVTGTAPTVEGQTTAPAVNKQEPVVANSIAGLTVTYLPNRNRDFSQFAQLAAGVGPDPDEKGLVVAGQRPENSKVSIDGADFNDPLNGGQRGAHDGSLFFPQTVVREFQIVHAGATADVGGTNAGFVNVVTKSGANKKRAEGFFIGRPATLTSRDAFGHELDNRQYEFGGSVGGPIKKDRAFFYLGAEQDFLRVPYWFDPAPQMAGTVAPAASAQIVSHSNPGAVFGRGDFLVGKASTLNLQLNANRIEVSNLNSGSTRTLAAPEHQDALRGNSEWLRGNVTSVVTPTLVNQLLAQWSRDRRQLTPNSTATEQVVLGYAIFGGDSLAPSRTTSQHVQFSDDVSLTRGASIFHFGGYFAFDPASELRVPFLTDRFDYRSVSQFSQQSWSRRRKSTITGEPEYAATIQRAAFYLDDKFSLTPKLTLTAGLRWEAQWNPQPPHPNPTIAQTRHIPSDASMWQPRLGLAWNPRGSTTVRASAGLYDAQTPAAVFHRVFVENNVNTQLFDSYFFDALVPRDMHVVGIAPDFRNPRSFQVSATIEQQLGNKITASLGYLRNSTWALPRRLNENLLPSLPNSLGLPTFALANDSVGELLINESNAHSTYDGMLLTATLQLSRRSSITANYTFSHTRDDDTTTGPYGRDAALDPFHLELERADSNLDIRHNFNLSAVFNFPLGLKFNPIVIARSGAPYTPIIGFDTQFDGNDRNDRAVLNGKVSSRNSLRQPAFFNLDFRFVKDITLRGEGHHLDLFFDVFNVTGASNRNFGSDAISEFGLPTAPVFSAAQPLFAPSTTRFGSARQVQFTARIVAF